MRTALFVAAAAVLAASSQARAQGNDLYRTELQAISHVESSGGKNTNHRPMTAGLHRGTRAGGFYGVMPKTVKYIIQATPALRAKYETWLNRDAQSITAELNSNRSFDEDVAYAMWKRLRQWYGPEVAAYAWLHGWGAVEKVSLEQIRAHSYVRKFKRELRELRGTRNDRRLARVQ